MAEQVQAALDQMVAPLRDLMDRNIFSEVEIKAIVARRRESEYLLRRRAARKADFLRYIEIEQKLEELRKLRTHQRKRDHRNSRSNENEKQDGDTKKTKQHIGDVHIIQHLHLLFVRAIRKFRSDLSLHLLHADFCKEQKAWTRLGRVYAEALQIFPRQTGLWIEAASQEFFGINRSIGAARVLMQRGLRINPNSEDMWMEYFSLELHYAQTLKGRRQILMGSSESDTKSGKGEENSAVDAEAEKDYKIASIVLKNAIKSIPNSIPFRLRFLDTCSRFPNTQGLMDSIQAPLQRDFSSKPEAWIARALYEANKAAGNGEDANTTKMEQSAAKERDGSAEESDENESDSDNEKDDSHRPSKRSRARNTVVATLEEGLDSVETDEMYVQALRFAQQYQDQEERKGNGAAVQEVQQLIQSKLLVRRASQGSSDLALEQADCYSSVLGNDEKAIEILLEFCTKNSRRQNGKESNKTTASAAVWIRWASLVSDQANDEKGNAAGKILKRALNRIPMNDPDHVSVLLQYFGSLLSITNDGKAKATASDDEDEDDKRSVDNHRTTLEETFQRIVLLAPASSNLIVEEAKGLSFGIESVLDAYLQYLKTISQRYGVVAGRKVYQLVLFQSSTMIQQVLNENNVDQMKAFVDCCLALEEMQQKEDDPKLSKNLNKSRSFSNHTISKKLSKKNQSRLVRLYDKILEIFEDTPLEGIYRERRSNDNGIFQ